MVSVNGNFNETKIYRSHGDRQGANYILTRPVVDFSQSVNMAQSLKNRIKMYAVDNKPSKAWTVSVTIYKVFMFYVRQRKGKINIQDFVCVFC